MGKFFIILFNITGIFWLMFFSSFENEQYFSVCSLIGRFIVALLPFIIVMGIGIICDVRIAEKYKNEKRREQREHEDYIFMKNLNEDFGIKE